jgi:predicted transcriptional regulator of viral defense system
MRVLARERKTAVQTNIFKKIAQMPQTVFSFKELMLIFNTDNLNNLKSQLNYYVSSGDLYSIRRGLYAKNANYDQLELATKILTPAYISFETVLAKEGIIFQYYSQIFVASYQSRDIVCDGKTYIFRTLKPTILTNTMGVEMHDNYSIASSERAFLDIVYLNKSYHFDNLEPLNWKRVYEILPIYGKNKSMRKRVDIYHESFKESMGK